MPNNTFQLRADGYWYAPPKDPKDTLDYPVDFSGLMEGDSDSIVSLAVLVEDPTGSLQLVRQVVGSLQSAKLVVLWFSGGTTGTAPRINMTVTTTNGRVIDRDFKLEILEL